MVYFHQYDYVFALGIIGAFLDAFGNGANDVANSFATSVSSRSLTLFQACCLAVICEFLGAVLVGSRVAGVIRRQILKVDLFREDPAVLMLGMACALLGSSTFVILATRYRFPVSSTHSIIGALAGVGVATGDGGQVMWGWTGLSQIFASWGIAPIIGGGFSIVIYLITKYAILVRPNSTIVAVWSIPIYFFITIGILTMTILWNGAPRLHLSNLSVGATATGILVTASVAALWAAAFMVPYVYARAVQGDYTVRWYHLSFGPLLWWRQAPSDASPSTADVAVPDYYRGHRSRTSDIAMVDPANPEAAHSRQEKFSQEKSACGSDVGILHRHPSAGGDAGSEKTLSLGLKIFKLICKTPLGGPFVDVLEMQIKGGNKEQARIDRMHARAAQYDNKTEFAYSFIQVLTACTMSFAHGSNDIANSVGPVATLYFIWSTGELSLSSEIPVWILAFCAASLCVGLWTYGYNIMRVLGNRITLHSPSRGFAMELGSAITVLIASRLALPVSTTQILCGSTVAVGLASGAKAINWRMVLWIVFGWVITAPLAGLFAGIPYAIIIYAPRLGMPS